MYGNTIDTPKNYGNAITIVSQNRKPYTPAVANQIHGNKVTIRSGTHGVIGAASDAGEDADVAVSNRLYANTYHLSNPGKDYWIWGGASRTLASVQALGQEVGSTVDGSLGYPLGLSCASLAGSR